MSRGITQDVELRTARLLDDLAVLEAMADVDLEIEMTSLLENMKMLRVDIAAHQRGEAERDHGWQCRAQHALVRLQSRHRLCLGETNRRRLAREDDRRAAVAAQQEDNVRRQRLRRRNDAFLRHATAMLPKETTKAIWDAVNAEAVA